MKSRYMTGVGVCEPWEYLVLFSRVYQELVHSYQRVIIYGCGPLTELLFQRFEMEKLNILAFSDGNALTWGKMFYGKPVISPGEINQQGVKAVIIISGSRQQEMKKSLETVLKPGIELIPAFTFHYYHPVESIDINPLQPGQPGVETWPGEKLIWERLGTARTICCFLDMYQLVPGILNALTWLKQRGVDLRILTESHAIIQGLQERGFATVDINQEWGAFRAHLSRETNLVEAEGESIQEFSHSRLASDFKFPGTGYRLFDAMFFDRLMFSRIEQTGLEEFAKQLLTRESWDTFLYIGPMNSSRAFAFLYTSEGLKRKTVFIPVNYKKSLLIEGFLKDHPAIFQASAMADRVNLKTITLVRDWLHKLGLKKPALPGPMVLVPFLLEKRWETREILYQLAEQNLEKKGTIVLKCREKMNSSTGAVTEMAFCQEYMALLLKKYPCICLIDDELTLEEGVTSAQRVVAAGECKAMELAAHLGIPYEIIS